MQPQQPQAQGWQHSAYGGQPPQPYGQPVPGLAGPVADVGLTGSIPCPTCGTPLSSDSQGAYAGRMVGGLVGWMLVKAIQSNYYCSVHGQIPVHMLPPQHQSAIRKRKTMLVVGAVLLLVVVFVLIDISNAL